MIPLKENETLKIYCVYHEDGQKKTYNLDSLDKRYFTLYNVNSFKNGDSVNYMNFYLNEFVAQYYIYKNNIKTDYVGFCHYQRQINLDTVNNLSDSFTYIKESENGHNTYDSYIYQLGKPFYYKESFIPLLKKRYYRLYLFLLSLQGKPLHNFPFKEKYIVKWEDFKNIIACIEDFLISFNTSNNISFNEYQYRSVINDKIITNTPILYCFAFQGTDLIFGRKEYRNISFFIEFIEGILLKYYISTQ